MSKVLWKTALVDEVSAQTMAEAAGVPVRVARWLCSRGISTDEARTWLQPEEASYHLPGNFLDMERAVHRISEAISAKERIAVVGDYDVDGVTASTILVSTLTRLGADCVCDIPHRIDDGYGLSEGIVLRLAEQGAGLLVTVDNGIRSTEAIQLAVDLGIDVVVTDHHEPGPTLPDSAVAIVHWSKAQPHVDLTHLSGAGVAWKLCEALLAATQDTEVKVSNSDTDTAEHTLWLKGLAALGALADVMPMRLENRKLVSEGIAYLKTCQRPGWKALCEVARVAPGELTDRNLLWRITPRLNAAGRMDSADLAFKLLMAESRESAADLAETIEALNQRRRQETDRAVTEAQAQCTAMASEFTGGLVVAGPWNQGVVGIVAARLVDIFARPVIVFAEGGGALLKGSGRAPDGISLYGALEHCADTLHHFGGHDAAVGCGVDASNLAAFRQCFSDACHALSTPAEDAPAESALPLSADDFLPLSEANLTTLAWIERFAPYGPENPPLQFYVGPLEVKAIDMVGNGKHARLRVVEGDTPAELIWFSAPDGVEHWGKGMLISAVVELEENTWRDVRKAQLRVVEARRLRRPLTRTEFGAVYRFLRSRRKVMQDDVRQFLPEAKTEEIHTVMEAFVELGFAERRESAYHVVEHAPFRDLRESAQYHNHLCNAMLDVQAIGSETIDSE